MGKIPNELRQIIARNIRVCRMKKFPGRGGSRKCAKDFGVSQQQWSPWERGKRTPDEGRLEKIAEFLGVTVEYLRRDNRLPPPPPPDAAHHEPRLTLDEIPGIDIPPPRGWRQDAPGTPASFYWLARHFLTIMQLQGLKIDKYCLDYLVNAMKKPPESN